jgi:uncharacterized surface anchored protein
MPEGYRIDMDRINFTIRADTITNLTVNARAIPQPTVTPEPTPASATQSTQPPASTTQSQDSATNRPSQARNNVEIITRAEQSGNPLYGATFAVYRVSDNQRVGEVTTDVNGIATLNLSPGEYYLRNNSVQFGFLLENSRIFFTVASSGNVLVEVTIQRDANIPYVDGGNITLPQTGELTPLMNYVLGTLFILFGLFCGAVLVYQHKQEQRWRKRYKRNRNLRKGAKAYA